MAFYRVFYGFFALNSHSNWISIHSDSWPMNARVSVHGAEWLCMDDVWCVCVCSTIAALNSHKCRRTLIECFIIRSFLSSLRFSARSHYEFAMDLMNMFIIGFKLSRTHMPHMNMYDIIAGAILSIGALCCHLEKIIHKWRQTLQSMKKKHVEWCEPHVLSSPRFDIKIDLLCRMAWAHGELRTCFNDHFIQVQFVSNSVVQRQTCNNLNQIDTSCSLKCWHWTIYCNHFDK